MANNILIVDDEPAIREMIGFALRRASYTFQEAGDAEEAQALITTDPPILILLDLMLPGLSGIDFARRLKKSEHTRQLPIIMLTAMGEPADKVKGLELGADDYITKPFSPIEMMARIKAVLRRTAPQATDDILEINGLRLDPNSRNVKIKNHFLPMGPTEFRLLHFFLTHAERVYSRSQLLDLVWGSNVYVEERTVDVHIRRLRKALEGPGYDHLIRTVRSAGYRLSWESFQSP